MNLANSRKEMKGDCLKPTLPLRLLTSHHLSRLEGLRASTHVHVQTGLVTCWTRKELQKAGRTHRSGEGGAPGGGSLLLRMHLGLLLLPDDLL